MAGSSTFTWAHALTLHSTLSPFDSPLPGTHSAFAGVKPVSWKRLNIAGMLVTIYGLAELPSDVSQVACLWLLHGRGDTQDSMAYSAAAFLAAWNGTRREGEKGLICVNFDQRNHGSRMVHNLANLSWSQKNATHGQDMFGIYSGTAADASLLVSHLPGYLDVNITEHVCAGVSLGGHATWHVLMADERVKAGIVVIGCPDYVRLMKDRAIRGKLATTTDTDPPGGNFLGSKDFPPSLLAAVTAHDPAGILATSSALDRPPSAEEQARLRPIVQQRLGGKKVLVLSGGRDRLVPYACAEPFLAWFKKALDPREGWCDGFGVQVQDTVDPAAGHEFSGHMREEAEKWLCDVLRAGSKEAAGGRESKM